MDNELIKRYYLRLMYGEINEYEDVIDYLTEYLYNNPNDPIVLNNRGLAYVEIGKNEEAFSDLKNSITLKANETIPYRIIADLLKSQDKFELAIKYYTTALELNKDKIPLYKLRANCYEQIGESELANQDNKEAEKLQK
ncbi:tetratricopeptide repeat protein [Lysinibacillus agricola]|uniref:Tetratricopeptide repeat protein n=1 Tax=Lysinibacillus agricola TaxID=2590012 RepID=A0ABX7ALB6_9BACI|nr:MULTISPECIES: tetratricopeptide repeat protein [Lysinibacillus]KOS59899.1 hypothetical protein AN161_26670 [Lysinibacillus sp. FJAT-14222]QQP10677.1 tetratricopeptide repeat protein [Lysinibacillus agricola]